jgi:hypothetical protein
MPEPKSEKLESQVAREIDAYLAAIGLRVFRVDQGGGRFRRRARAPLELSVASPPGSSTGAC